MKKQVCLFMILFLTITFSAAFAARTGRPPAAKVDRNQDGVIDAKEMQMDRSREKRREHYEERRAWRMRKSKVNTAVEARYDANGDGWLQPEEARELVRSRYELVKTNGKAKVDTGLEAKYDANGDGVIEYSEAVIMQEDLKD